MGVLNEVIAEWKPGESLVGTSALTRFDYGQILKIIGGELPEEYDVEFALHEHGTIDETAEGDPAGVRIPDRLLQACTQHIYAWVVIKNGNSRKTLFEIVIPVRKRPAIETR